MVNYYGKFLQDLATTLTPLYYLLRKSTVWSWESKQRRAFRNVKDLLQSSRVQTHCNDQLPLILASPYGLGAVLSHRMPDGTEKTISFSSRSLSKKPRPTTLIWTRRLWLLYNMVSKSTISIYMAGDLRLKLITNHLPIFSMNHEQLRQWPLVASRGI